MDCQTRVKNLGSAGSQGPERGAGIVRDGIRGLGSCTTVPASVPLCLSRGAKEMEPGGPGSSPGTPTGTGSQTPRGSQMVVEGLRFPSKLSLGNKRK